MKKYLLTLLMLAVVSVQAKELSLQEVTIPGAEYARSPLSPDDLIAEKKAVITSQAYSSLMRNLPGDRTYRSVVDIRSEVSRVKAQFARYHVRFEVVCGDCENHGTFTVGFFDVKLTGENSDIQRLLMNQHKQNGFTILWIGLREPKTFIDLISSFF